MCFPLACASPLLSAAISLSPTNQTQHFFRNTIDPISYPLPHSKKTMNLCAILVLLACASAQVYLDATPILIRKIESERRMAGEKREWQHCHRRKCSRRGPYRSDASGYPRRSLLPIQRFCVRSMRLSHSQLRVGRQRHLDVLPPFHDRLRFGRQGDLDPVRGNRYRCRDLVALGVCCDA